MRYAQIREYDVANGPGIRTSIFVTGCTRCCKNCFNEEYQSFEFGDLWTREESDLVISYLKQDSVQGLTLLGGEPFENEEDLIDILKYIKSKVHKDIWIFSGFTFEEIMKDDSKKELLSLCDVLVDGPFIEAKKDLMLKFRGSSNQRILDVGRSLKENKPVLFDI